MYYVGKITSYIARIATEGNFLPPPCLPSLWYNNQNILILSHCKADGKSQNCVKVTVLPKKQWLPLHHLRSCCTGGGVQRTQGKSCNLQYHPLHCLQHPEFSRLDQGSFQSLKEVSTQGMQLLELSSPVLSAHSLFLASEDSIVFLQFPDQPHP